MHQVFINSVLLRFKCLNNYYKGTKVYNNITRTLGSYASQSRGEEKSGKRSNQTGRALQGQLFTLLYIMLGNLNFKFKFYSFGHILKTFLTKSNHAKALK